MSRFDRLYRENFRFVWAAAQRCGAPPGCVDDVVQDVFVTAYRRLEDLHWEVSARGWLYGVTRRVAFRYRRSAARVARRKSAVARGGPHTAQPHRRHDAAVSLDRMLDRLEPAQREVFVMAELLGMSAPEIAAEVDAPLNTVYSRLRLARGRLRKLAGSEDALAGELNSSKEELAPAPGQSQRTHAALLPLLGAPSTLLPPALAGALKLAAIPTALLLAAGGVVVASSTSDAKPAAASPEVAEARSVPTSEGPAAQPPPAPVAAEPVSADLNPQPPPSVSRPVARTTRVAKSVPRVDVEPQGRKPSPGLRKELALIDAAKRLARAGSPDAALRKLDEHARTFPSGQLLDAQKATRFSVLCDAGRVEEADAAAARLHRQHPDSSVARKVPTKCVQP